MLKSIVTILMTLAVLLTATTVSAQTVPKTFDADLSNDFLIVDGDWWIGFQAKGFGLNAGEIDGATRSSEGGGAGFTAVYLNKSLALKFDAEFFAGSNSTYGFKGGMGVGAGPEGAFFHAGPYLNLGMISVYGSYAMVMTSGMFVNIRVNSIDFGFTGGIISVPFGFEYSNGKQWVAGGEGGFYITFF